MPGPFGAPRLWIAIAILAALGLSARSAWQLRDVPQFGFLHDDGIYLVSAKSLADFGTYRITSLPGEPWQTKYPPLYPLILSMAVKASGGYPQCLPWAAQLGWLTIPILILLSVLLFEQYGIGGWRAGILGILLALNPYVSLFGVNLLSESLFLCLLLASFLLAARNRPMAAGWMAAAAYLARNAGIVLLASQSLAFWLRGNRRDALRFIAGMLPVVAGWMLWTRLHIPPPGQDSILTYYTDYFRYQIDNTPLSIIHIILWKNLDGLLYSLGSLVFPKVFELLPAKILAQVIALAMISGTIRLARRVPLARDYAWFAAASSALLLIWHFPPTERFVLPMLPLLLAGLLEELEHISALIRAALKHRDRSQRVVAAGMGAVAGLFILACLGLQIWVGQVYLQQGAEVWRERRLARQPAYEWIRKNTSPDAVFVAYDDAPLYLETGRHAFSVPLPTRYWYQENYAAQVDVYRNISTLARNHRARYIYYTSDDLDRDAAPEQREAVKQSMRDNVELRPVWQGSRGTIYEVK